MTSDQIDIQPYYDRGTEQYGSKKIPKRFIQTWKTSLIDAPHARQLIEFRQRHSEFSFEFYDDDRMNEYMCQNWSTEPIFEIFKNSKWGASRADIWRYCCLYQHGGIYLDFDSTIDFDMNSIPEDLPELISFESNKLTNFVVDEDQPNFSVFRDSNFREDSLEFPEYPVLQWCLIFSPKHEILRLAIELIVKHSAYYRNRKFPSVHNAIINFTAPILLTHAVWLYTRSGHRVSQLGIDFRGLAAFKNIPAPAESSYVKELPYAYHEKRDDEILVDAVRLNLGCGSHVMAGFINIDLVPSSDKVVAMDVKDLQFAEGSVDEIYAKGILEHIGLPDALRSLVHWCSLLKPDGIMTIQTTCFALFVDAFKCGALNVSALNCLIFAGVDGSKRTPEGSTSSVKDFDWRKSIYTEEFLRGALRSQNCEIMSVHRDPYDDLVGDPFTVGMNHGLNIRIRARKLPAQTKA
jgi:hypothetical protein